MSQGSTEPHEAITAPRQLWGGAQKGEGGSRGAGFEVGNHSTGPRACS